jgi:hypothetical protein
MYEWHAHRRSISNEPGYATLKMVDAKSIENNGMALVPSYEIFKIFHSFFHFFPPYLHKNSLNIFISPKLGELIFLDNHLFPSYKITHSITSQNGCFPLNCKTLYFISL